MFRWVTAFAGAEGFRSLLRQGKRLNGADRFPEGRRRMSGCCSEGRFGAGFRRRYGLRFGLRFGVRFGRVGGCRKRGEGGKEEGRKRGGLEGGFRARSPPGSPRNFALHSLPELTAPGTT